MSVEVRQITADDRAEWVRMRDALWPGAPDEHEAETRSYFAEGGQGLLVLIAVVDGAVAGFLELDDRKEAPGCSDSPVAFIEGWYVDPHVRNGGVGRALVEAAEQVARDRGRTEIASDVDIGNAMGLGAHRALGFAEVERVAFFRKPLA